MGNKIDVLVFFSGLILTRAVINQLQEHGRDIFNLKIVSTAPSDSGRKISVDSTGEVFTVSLISVPSDLGSYFDIIVNLSHINSATKIVQEISHKCSIIIDTSGQIESGSTAIPNMELGSKDDDMSTVISCPHYASIQIASIAKAALNAGELLSIDCAILCPASEYDKDGIDELHNSTKQMMLPPELSMHSTMERLAFNCLPSVGDILQNGDTSLEERIKREFRALIDKVEISVTCIAVPVFIGSSSIVKLTYATPTTPKEFIASIDKYYKGSMECRRPAETGEEFYTPRDVVGCDTIQIARVRKSHNNSMVLWSCCDNIRIVSTNVSDIIFEAIANGKI